jgi:phosphotransacetylase
VREPKFTASSRRAHGTAKAKISLAEADLEAAGRQIVGGVVDGPLDLDIAVDKEAARIKGVETLRRSPGLSLLKTSKH